MIPQRLSRAIAKQDTAILHEIRELVDSLIDERTEISDTRASDARASDASHPHREVLDEKKSGSITYRLERVSCGKGCKGCPHGPYWYGY
jgi:hypothetical protein